MKILLDHCLDWRLGHSVPDHIVKSVGKLRWSHFKDRELLEKAEREFDVLVTSDKNIRREQNISHYRLAVVILDVPSNRIEDCLPKMPLLCAALPRLIKGRVTVI